jgi:hypothetical protein
MNRMEYGGSARRKALCRARLKSSGLCAWETPYPAGDPRSERAGDLNETCTGKWHADA